MRRHNHDKGVVMGQKSHQDTHIREFLIALSAEKGSASKTIQAYERDLYDCDDFLQQQGQSLASADSEMLRALLTNLLTFAAKRYAQIIPPPIFQTQN